MKRTRHLGTTFGLAFALATATTAGASGDQYIVSAPAVDLAVAPEKPAIVVDADSPRIAMWPSAIVFNSALVVEGVPRASVEARLERAPRGYITLQPDQYVPVGHVLIDLAPVTQMQYAEITGAVERVMARSESIDGGLNIFWEAEQVIPVPAECARDLIRARAAAKSEPCVPRTPHVSG